MECSLFRETERRGRVTDTHSPSQVQSPLVCKDQRQEVPLQGRVREGGMERARGEGGRDGKSEGGGREGGMERARGEGWKEQGGREGESKGGGRERGAREEGSGNIIILRGGGDGVGLTMTVMQSQDIFQSISSFVWSFVRPIFYYSCVYTY